MAVTDNMYLRILLIMKLLDIFYYLIIYKFGIISILLYLKNGITNPTMLMPIRAWRMLAVTRI